MEFKSQRKFDGDTIIQKDASEEPVYLGFVSGWAATSLKDRYGDVITNEALKSGAKDLVKVGTVFANHEYSLKDAIGKVLSAEFRMNDNFSGIYIKVGISKTATEIWTKINEQIIDSFSIGGIFNEIEYDKDLEVWKIKEMDLWEVSIVGLPANTGALIQSFDAAAQKFMKRFETAKKLKQKQIKEKEKEEVIKVPNDEIPEWATKLQGLAKQIDEIKDISQKSVATDKALTVLTESVTQLAGAMTPLLEETQRKKEIAERKSAVYADAVSKFEKMTPRQKETFEMRKIIETLQDPAVSEVMILGDLEYIPPIHQRSIEEIVEEKRRLGV